MAIPKNSNEFNLWKEVYLLRSKYANEVKTDEQFKMVMKEAGKLYDKYKDTDAAVPARWCCSMIREIFNNEWMIEHRNG